MSAIKLSTPSSGSISLSPADTASNLTITVPAVSGTMITTTGGVAPSTAGNVLTSNGTTWTSASAPSPAALSTATGSAPSYSARAWVNFNGTGTPSVTASGNVSSITDIGTGNYKANFTTAMSDANYTPVLGYSVNGSTYSAIGLPPTPYLAETSGVTMQFSSTDCVGCYLAVFR
jgi:hypothetical protein